jgi:hypothetical protein
MLQLNSLGFLANPLQIIVMPEPVAVALGDSTGGLDLQEPVVLTYPLVIEVESPRQTVDGFNINVLGPPGVYTLFSSDDLTTWTEIGTDTNSLGDARFDDNTPAATQRFYRASSVQ